jgi:hypothetical protein
MIKTGESYYKIRGMLKTGDIIFFRGNEFVSNLISKLEKKICGNGDFTHVGMVIMCTSFPEGHPYYNTNGIPYVIESTQSGYLGDGAYNLNGDSFLGVQVRNLDIVMEKYDSNPKTAIAWGKLQHNIDGDISHIIRKYDGIRYNINIVDLLAASFKPLRILRKFFKFARKWKFCSEVVTDLYKEFGILNNNVTSYNVLPCDFLPKENNTTFDTDGEIPILFTEIINITIHNKYIDPTVIISTLI